MKLAELCQELHVVWPNPMFFPAPLSNKRPGDGKPLKMSLSASISRCFRPFSCVFKAYVRCILLSGMSSAMRRESHLPRGAPEKLP